MGKHYVNFETEFTDLQNAIRKHCKAHSIKYEVSAVLNLAHFEILADSNEVEAINSLIADFFDRL